MFNLDGFIPKLCQLAQEVGDDERVRDLRAAGLQALSAMVLCSYSPSIILLRVHTLDIIIIRHTRDISHSSSCTY